MYVFVYWCASYNITVLLIFFIQSMAVCRFWLWKCCSRRQMKMRRQFFHFWWWSKRFATGSSWSCSGVWKSSFPAWRRVLSRFRTYLMNPLKTKLRPSPVDWVKKGRIGMRIPPTHGRTHSQNILSSCPGPPSGSTAVSPKDAWDEFMSNNFIEEAVKCTNLEGRQTAMANRSGETIKRTNTTTTTTTTNRISTTIDREQFSMTMSRKYSLDLS